VSERSPLELGAAEAGDLLALEMDAKEAGGLSASERSRGVQEQAASAASEMAAEMDSVEQRRT
jgi:hypothetical protein